MALRTLVRHRAPLMQHRAPQVLHRQTALVQMHMQLSQALSDVTGTTGQRIIRAMVADERAPPLAALRNDRCQKESDDIARALTGPWREEHRLVLKQALALFDCYTAHRSECDTQIERAFSLMRPRFEPAPEEPLSTRPTPLHKGHLQ